MKLKTRGGIMALVGYLLSPLSWWNDLLVNIPLAYVFAVPFGWIDDKLFLPMMILGYWLTNVAGFVLMHKGVNDLRSKQKGSKTRIELAKDILWSVGYTVLVIILAKMGWIKFPWEYFGR